MEIKDVEKLAELARIDLSDEEKIVILKDMGGILAYVKEIEKIELGEVGSSFDLKNVWRDDEIENRDFSREEIINQFPDKQDVFLKVKKIL